MGSYFATNPKMVLINVDQCIIWDIVLAVDFTLRKFDYSSVSNMVNLFLSSFCRCRVRVKYRDLAWISEVVIGGQRGKAATPPAPSPSETKSDLEVHFGFT